MKVWLSLCFLYSAKLVLSKPLDVSHSKSYIIASRGERFLLPCGIKQSAICQWTKDGFGLGTQTDLPGWPRYSLVVSDEGECDLLIDPVLPMDEGIYQCQGGGISGENVMVTVIAEPGLPYIDQAKDGDVIKVEEDEEVILDCGSNGGRPAADIDWTYGNIKVIEMRRTVVRMEDFHTDPGPQKKTHLKNPYQLAIEDKKTFKTTSTLRFSTKEDAEISCSAFNEDFTTPRTSRILHVKVKYRPKVEMKFIEEKLKEGDDLEVECSVKAYPVDITYKWFVDDVEQEGYKGSVFKMKKITRKHNKANVICLVENEVGKSEVVKSLNVEFGPEIVTQPVTMHVRRGDKVTFTCKANANPEPTYIWIKRTSLSSSEVVGAGENLSIIASDETENEYVCQVVSEGFPIISTSPAHLVMEREAGIIKEREPTMLPILEGSELADPTMLPILTESKTNTDSFTKVIKSFKKDYLLFQKRTEKYMKQIDKYFIDSNKFEKKYKIFKKKIKKFPKNFRKFLKVADIL